MKITSKGRYGLTAMIELFRANSILKNREIANKHNIPLKYLEQIINLLKKSGLVISIRGAEGGYRLARSGDEISIFEILEALEGNLSVMDASESSKSTEMMSVFWSKIDMDIQSMLKISLADFVIEMDKSVENTMFHI